MPSGDSLVIAHISTIVSTQFVAFVRDFLLMLSRMTGARARSQKTSRLRARAPFH
jgi:hypothetical protein